MKVYKTQKEIEKDIKNGELYIDGDVKFECSFVIDANIRVEGNINAYNIDAGDINARDINAWNINAENINARDINYYAVCFAHASFKCKSVEGRRENCRHFCLDGEIEYKDEDDDKTEEAIELLKSKGYRIVKK